MRIVRRGGANSLMDPDSSQNRGVWLQELGIPYAPSKWGFSGLGLAFSSCSTAT